MAKLIGHIFYNNYPAGITRDGAGNIIYDRVVGFRDISKRDEYIKKYLNNDFDYNQTLATFDYIPGTELFHTFDVPDSYAATRDDLENSDYAVFIKNNEPHFFFLKQIQSERPGFVRFRADLDIVMTHPLNKDGVLDPNAELFIKRAHVDRFTDRNQIDFEKLLKNKNLPVSVNKTLRVHDVNEYDTKIQMKWVVAFVQRDVLGDMWENYSNGIALDKTSINAMQTYNHGTLLPYTIFLFPVLSGTDAQGIDINFRGQVVSYKPKFLTTLLRKFGAYLIDKRVRLKDLSDLAISNQNINIERKVTNFADGSTSVRYEIKKNSNYYGINFRRAKLDKKTEAYKKSDKYIALKKKYEACENNPCRDSVSQLIIDAAQEHQKNTPNTDTDEIFIYVENINALLPDDLSNFPKLSFSPLLIRNLGINGNFVQYNELEDPILLHPEVYQFTIKKWNSVSKTYHFPFLQTFINSDNKPAINLLNLYSWDPANDKNIWWLDYDPRFKNEVVEGDYLEIDNAESMTVSQSQAEELFLNQRETFNLSYEQQRAQAELSKTQSVIGVASSLAFGIASRNPLSLAGIGGSVVGFQQASLRLRQIDAMRNATLRDLYNKPATIYTGTAGFLSQFVNKYLNSEGDSIKIVERGLLPASKRQLLDSVKRFGYEVNEFGKLSDYWGKRKYWSYFEIDGLFNAFKKKLSSPIKELYASSFQRGVTVVYYDKDEDWHGILPYDKDNVEV